MDNQLRDDIAHLHSQICSGLADPTRILLLYSLAGRPHNVGELAESLEVSQSAVSRHLQILRERGLVCAERERQRVVYALGDDRVIQALDLLRAVMGDRLESQCVLARSATKPSS